MPLRDKAEMVEYLRGMPLGMPLFLWDGCVVALVEVTAM